MLPAACITATTAFERMWLNGHRRRDTLAIARRSTEIFRLVCYRFIGIGAMLILNLALELSPHS